ncbi:hypothetical protein TNCT_595981 [Trichonephila clavata]|uniref:Uncharacterized protein n=1 Tax=Trichonephila clavata TaxID=2740835 RepID=A0A8X6KND9_TRICU|nr:hypothetical protein TNCT_595981 [Trichonephila clavata]
MSYNPKMGLLKSPARSIFTGWPNVKKDHSRVMNMSTGPIDPRGILTSFIDKNCDPVEANGTPLKRDDPTATLTYGNIIEKGTMHCKGFHPQTQPTLHVGIQPVPSLSTRNMSTGDVTKWTDTQGYFEVEATMVVKCDAPTMRPFANFINVPPHEEIRHFKNTSVNVSKSMYYGLYQA